MLGYLARSVSMLCSALLVATSSFASAQDGGGLAPGEIADVRDACRQLVTGYAFHRDLADAEAVSALFTEDATSEIFGDVLHGNVAIGARVTARPGDPTYRHLMSTIHITVDGPARARGVSYVSVYAAAGTLPAAAMRLAAIGEYHDDFVKTADGWKIKRRRFLPALLPPTSGAD